MTDETDERRYVRAVEQAWARTRGRPGVLTRRDFEVVASWRRRGIPVSIVLEALEHKRRRAHAAPATLAGIAPSVEEGWAAVAAGRAAAAPGPSADPPSSERGWREAIARAPEGSALRDLLQRAEAGLGERELDAALPANVPAPTLEQAESETRAALAAYRARMSADDYRATFARALADRLRLAIGLPPRENLG